MHNDTELSLVVSRSSFVMLWHIVLFLRHYVAELSMFKFEIIAMMSMNLHITRS